MGKEDLDKKIYAKDYKCVRCGREAEVFWPVIDPDIKSSPYCNPCVKEKEIELMIRLGEIEDVYRKKEN